MDAPDTPALAGRRRRAITPENQDTVAIRSGRVALRPALRRALDCVRRKEWMEGTGLPQRPANHLLHTSDAKGAHHGDVRSAGIPSTTSVLGLDGAPARRLCRPVRLELVPRAARALHLREDGARLSHLGPPRVARAHADHSHARRVLRQPRLVRRGSHGAHRDAGVLRVAARPAGQGAGAARGAHAAGPALRAPEGRAKELEARRSVGHIAEQVSDQLAVGRPRSPALRRSRRALPHRHPGQHLRPREPSQGPGCRRAAEQCPVQRRVRVQGQVPRCELLGHRADRRGAELPGIRRPVPGKGQARGRNDEARSRRHDRRRRRHLRDRHPASHRRADARQSLPLLAAAAAGLAAVPAGRSPGPEGQPVHHGRPARQDWLHRRHRLRGLSRARS